MTTTDRIVAGFADKLLAHRKFFAVFFALTTLFFAWSASNVRLDPGFLKLIPIEHEYMVTMMDYMDEKEITYYQSSEEFFKSKKNQRIVLMTTKASVSYTKFKFNKNDTILFGRESAGVPENIHKQVKDRLKIPMKNNMRSLNISSSVAIILAESLKQTRLL